MTLMDITRDEVENVLIDGDKAAMLGLRCPDCGSSIDYVYSEQYDALDIACSCQVDHLHGVPKHPNCVKFFGNQHVFN